MASRGTVLVMVLAMLAMLVVVRPAESGFASEAHDVDVSGWGSMFHEDAVEEFLDEPTRRMLGGRTYISYGALNGNRAPCPSASGRSYYNPGCSGAGGGSSPYKRGCSAITRCARG